MVRSAFIRRRLAAGRLRRVSQDGREQHSTAWPSESTPSVGSVPSLCAAIPSVISWTSPRTSSANRGSVPIVAARENSMPSSAARSRASVSRSHTTSMWSETKPIGRRRSPRRTPAAAARRGDRRRRVPATAPAAGPTATATPGRSRRRRPRPATSARGLGDLAAVEVAARDGGPPVASAAHGHRVRGEHQPRGVARDLVGNSRAGRGDRVGEHLDEQRMVEVLAQFHQLRGTGPDRVAGPRDVLVVLRGTRSSRPTPTWRTPARGGPRRAPSPRRCPRPSGASCGCRSRPADRSVRIELARIASISVAVERVDRRDTTEVQVVLGDVVEPFRRDPAAAGDVLQERPHLVGALRDHRRTAAAGRRPRSSISARSAARQAPKLRGWRRRRRRRSSRWWPGSQSDSSAHTVFATGVGSFMFQPIGARRPSPLRAGSSARARRRGRRRRWPWPPASGSGPAATRFDRTPSGRPRGPRTG